MCGRDWQNVSVFCDGRMVEAMRKVIFTINDLEWMRKYYKLTEEQFAEMFKDQESF